MLEHPTFEKMIHIASRARDGVEIPSRKVARCKIISMFHQSMRDLKARLNVNDSFLSFITILTICAL